MFSNPNLKIILQTDFTTLMILSRLPCMIGQPCACSCVRFSRGPGDLPSLLGGRWRRGHWKNPEEDFHMSLEGGLGGDGGFLKRQGARCHWESGHCWRESISPAHRQGCLIYELNLVLTFTERCRPPCPILNFLGAIAKKMCTIGIGAIGVMSRKHGFLQNRATIADSFSF